MIFLNVWKKLVQQRESRVAEGQEQFKQWRPDLNPVDYKIWGCVQERMYQKPTRDVDQLKQRLIEVWSDVQQADSRRWGHWWMEEETQGLRPCEGASFWTSALIFYAVCCLLNLFI